MKRIAYITVDDEKTKEALTDAYANLTMHEGDAGLDLFILDHMVIANQMQLLDLDYQMVIADVSTQGELVDGMSNTHTPIAYMLMPRSSTHKLGIIQGNSVGLMDAGYRGNVLVPIICIEYPPINLKGMTRLFQAVPFDGKGVDEVHVLCNVSLEEMFPSARGTGGIGSTGS
jgi:dUTP pyrophosphatase